MQHQKSSQFLFRTATTIALLIIALFIQLTEQDAANAQTSPDPFDAAIALYRTDETAARTQAEEAIKRGEPWGWRFLLYTTASGLPNTAEDRLCRERFEHYVTASLNAHLPISFDVASCSTDYIWLDGLARKATAAGLLLDQQKQFVETISICAAAGPAVPADGDIERSRKAGSREKFPDNCNALYRADTSVRFGACVISRFQPDQTSWSVTFPYSWATIAEIYANGWGVNRDIRRATAFICHGQFGGAEQQGMVKALEERRQAVGGSLSVFRACDYATSGLFGGICSQQAYIADQTQRDREWAALSHDWSPREKQALAALRQSAQAFFEEHSRSEQDMSGTARVSIAIDEKNGLDQQLFDDVTTFERGLLPVDTDFQVADKYLNETYVEALKQYVTPDYAGSVSAEGIRATQRRWITYRDAFANFGVARYPLTTKNAWKAFATRERSTQLEQILDQD